MKQFKGQEEVILCFIWCIMVIMYLQRDIAGCVHEQSCL